jgi:WD40 repeat protein
MSFDQETFKEVLTVPDFPDIKLSFKDQISNQNIYYCDFSPDDKFIAACTDQGQVLIYDAANGKMIR